jgi:hypothetical protein
MAEAVAEELELEARAEEVFDFWSRPEPTTLPGHRTRSIWTCARSSPGSSTAPTSRSR